MATLNRNLNLVIPITRSDETVIHIHATPIRSETFEFYHMVLAKTWSGFVQNGLDPRSAPSVAALILKDTAKATMRAPGFNWFDGPDGVGGESGLIAEMIRLCNVIGPNKDGGWTTTPLQVAIDQNVIDSEEKAEIINILTFFTVASQMPPRPDRKTMIQGMAAIYELQTTYSSCTEYANSLKTSTTVEPTGENPQA